MKDTELRGRLIKLGMSPKRANAVAANIRDRIHPVAVVASNQLRDAVAINAQLNGLGYTGDDINDDMLGSLEGNIFKKLGKALKKVVKSVAKVAAVIPGPWQLPAAAITVGAAVRDKKKASKKAIAAAAAESGMTPAQYKLRLAADNAASKANAAALKAASLPPGKKKTKAEAAAAKLAAKAAAAAAKAGITTSTQVAQGATVVPAPIAAEAADVTASMLQNVAESGAGGGAVAQTPYDFMQSQLAAQGMNFNSPAAQDVLQDVAAQGVEATPGGPSALPPWVLPAAIGVAALGAVMLLGKKK
jgi:Sec-independent protein translocase protein TatA